MARILLLKIINRFHDTVSQKAWVKKMNKKEVVGREGIGMSSQVGANVQVNKKDNFHRKKVKC